MTKPNITIKRLWLTRYLDLEKIMLESDKDSSIIADKIREAMDIVWYAYLSKEEREQLTLRKTIDSSLDHA